MSGIPDKVEMAIVGALFADAERLKWPQMNSYQRSQQYRKWVLDSRIGGLLKQFMAGEEARVWIKDGPMKEFSRALHGHGKYATLLSVRAPEPGDLLCMALGPGWDLDAASQRIKPLRMLASNKAETIVFAWGPRRDFKHLVWAALSAYAKGDSRRWILCLTSPFVDPIPRDARIDNERIAARCGVEVVHVSLPEGQ